jgi:large subunit ribosomal protein L22
MEVVAKSDFLRISPRKLNLVAQSIKGLKATYALEVLKNLNKKAADLLILTLRQGIGNAVNNFNLDKESLVIKKIEVGKGPILKRGQPVARGQWHPILKRTSNLKIFLEGEEKKKIPNSKIQIPKKGKEELKTDGVKRRKNGE